MLATRKPTVNIKYEVVRSKMIEKYIAYNTNSQKAIRLTISRQQRTLPGIKKADDKGVNLPR